MRVLLTGATSGIGHAILQHFRKTGSRTVALGSGNTEARARLGLDAQGGQADVNFIPVDFRDGAAVSNAVSALRDPFDSIILCAGIANTYRPYDEIPPDHLEDVFSVNFFSTTIILNAAKRLLPHGGSIVFISSNTLKFNGSPFNAGYAASKSAAETYGLSIQKDLIARSIRFNIIRPGVIDSGMKNNVVGYDEEKYQERISLIPAGAPGATTDIVNLVAFLIDPKSAYISGQVISVAGGE